MQPGYEKLHRQRLHNLSRQPVPVLDHPYTINRSGLIHAFFKKTSVYTNSGIWAFILITLETHVKHSLMPSKKTGPDQDTDGYRPAAINIYLEV